MAAAALVPVAPAVAAPPFNDYCQEQCNDILPPGENGNATLVEIIAGAQDRLWLMDLLRHLGRGQLSSFAGGAAGNRQLEQDVWRNSPYNEADLQAQVDRLRLLGPA